MSAAAQFAAADVIASETVFELYTDTPENACCIVCGDPIDLNDTRLLCPDCRGRADHHDKEN